MMIAEKGASIFKYSHFNLVKLPIFDTINRVYGVYKCV